MRLYTKMGNDKVFIDENKLEKYQNEIKVINYIIDMVESENFHKKYDYFCCSFLNKDKWVYIYVSDRYGEIVNIDRIEYNSFYDCQFVLKKENENWYLNEFKNFNEFIIS